jgi:hypothetical protein
MKVIELTKRKIKLPDAFIFILELILPGHHQQAHKLSTCTSNSISYESTSLWRPYGVVISTPSFNVNSFVSRQMKVTAKA